MFLSLWEKLTIILKYSFSSFLEIELFMLALLFCLFLILNIRYKNKVVNSAISFLFLIFLLVLILTNGTYAVYCIDSLVKLVLNYIYFPSPVVYFFILLFVIVSMIVTIVSKNIPVFKKVINYVTFSLLYFFFFSFLGVVIINKLDLTDLVSLYTNNVVLSLVQISNLIFVIWLVFTAFCRLYKFFKRNYD